MRVLTDFLRALAMEFVRRRQDPRVQIKLRRVTSETSLVVRAEGAQLFLAKAIKSNHFTAASGRLLRFLALGRRRGWAIRCFSPGCGRGCGWSCRQTFFLVSRRQGLLHVCGRRTLLALDDLFELQTELHSRVEKTIDGFEWHGESFGDAAKREPDFKLFFAHLQIPELMLKDNCHFLGILRAQAVRHV